MDFDFGQVSRVLKLKIDNLLTGIRLVRLEPTSDRQSSWIGWRWVKRQWIGQVGQVADFHGHPYS